MIICGLYAVLWGKSKEMKKKNQLVPSESPHDQSDTVEIVVRSVDVKDKSIHDNCDVHGSTVQEVRDNTIEDSSVDHGHEVQSARVPNQGKELGGEGEGEISRNA